VSTAIRVQNLSKRYQIRHDSGVPYRTLRDELARVAGAPLRWLSGRANNSTEEFWALKDLNFEVQPGEVVGVIGRNGAGKSTLLKILSRITRPTTGRIELRGRVGSLLEVGTGFHPELTGRENIFLSGAVLGMKRAEIVRKFDEIAAFADVEKFLDTPVKRYSSGMYVRLAFSVAAHLEPDILIIDEVLAVGDAAFQKKCLGKVRDLADRQRTVLFVSHNLTAVQSLCDQAIWLDGGVLQCQGEASAVTSRYLNSVRQQPSQRSWQTPEQAPGNDLVRLHAVSAGRSGLTGRLTDDDRICVGDAVQVEFLFWLLVDDAIINPSVVIHNQDGVTVCNTYPPPPANLESVRCRAGLHRAAFQIPAHCLNDGRYDVQLYIIQDGMSCACRFDNVVQFEVDDDPSQRTSWFGKQLGVLRPRFAWQFECVERATARPAVSEPIA
jgi:lipopolysaccharide transport system ATP-binding protein